MKHVRIMDLGSGPFDKGATCFGCVIYFDEVVVRVGEETGFHFVFDLRGYAVRVEVDYCVDEVVLVK